MAKATYKRAARVADQIRMEVADILMRKAKDPRIGSVTVTDVELTNDLRLARVYVTTLQEDDGESDVLAGLAKASGFIRAELGRRLSLRYTPDLMFKKDVSGPRGDRILSLLEGLGAKRPNVQPRGNESSVAGGRHADDGRRSLGRRRDRESVSGKHPR